MVAIDVEADAVAGLRIDDQVRRRRTSPAAPSSRLLDQTVGEKTQLIENVWEWHFDTGTNVVEVYIQRLRKKVDEGHEVKLIHTIRGVGYVLRRQE